ncbi:hypothetical protein Pyn_08662 [Prunus yedoensis var. nudiflora]|uniref:Uncharacterized protein n=1 Tax=Prunus yedoensis var. nudiflora TaxID=2094558 RepID=A0A314ZQR4_PRUYE|nr:hypothetical protein Pyn_08662 [Prunus yedoensis var. nudiflora]
MGGAPRRIRVQSSFTRQGLGSCSSLYCCSYCLKQAWNGQLAPNARVLLRSWKHLLHAINQVPPWYYYRLGFVPQSLSL